MVRFPADARHDPRPCCRGGVGGAALAGPRVASTGAWHLAAAAGRLNVVTTTFDWNDRYNLWSGLIGGAFLALAYFGTDQSQVQRYLSAESLRDGRRGLLFNAVAKIPMQLCILFIGVLVFVFYVFTPPPMLFQPLDQAASRRPNSALDTRALKQRYDDARSVLVAAPPTACSRYQTGDVGHSGREPARGGFP